MRIFFVLLTFIFLINAVAQRHQIDSLSVLLNQHGAEDSARVSLLNELSHAYRETNPDTSISLGNEALELAGKLELTIQKAWALNHIGVAYWMKAHYPDALRYAQEALQLFEISQVNDGIAQSYNSIANTYNMQGEHLRSLEYYQKSINIYEILKDDHNIARAHANIGRTHYMLGEFSEALESLQRVLHMMEDQPQTKLYAIVLNTSGDVYQEQGRYDEALRSYLEALEITEALKIPRIITYSTRGLSEIYQLKEDLSSSNSYARQTLEISREIGYLENVKNAALILSENYKKQNDFSKAYDYYIEYTMAKDSMFNLERQRELQKLQESHEIAQQQKEILLLKTEKELQAEESNKQKLFLYSLGIVTALIIILVVILYRRNQLKQKANRLLWLQKNTLARQNIEIKQQREELKAHSEKLKEVGRMKDKLFSIVSHDLKSPFNSLLAITSLLDNQAISREDLSSLKNDLNTKISALLEMLNNLLFWAQSQLKGTKTKKESFNLVDLIRKNVEVFELMAREKKIGLKTQFGDDEFVFGDIDQIDCVIRNLVNNAIKFTKENGRVTVGFGDHSETHKRVWVEDTGVGMEPEITEKLFDPQEDIKTSGTANEPGSGIGLFLCKDFVENNGGRLWLESEADIGTTFYFTVPADQESSNVAPDE